MERFKDFLKKSLLKLENDNDNWFDEFDQQTRDIYFKEGLPIYNIGLKDWLASNPDSYQFKLNGEIRWIYKTIPISEELQQKLLKMDIRSIRFIANPSKELQEYVIKKRPELIKEIQNLDPELRMKYAPELDIASVEV